MHKRQKRAHQREREKELRRVKESEFFFLNSPAPNHRLAGSRDRTGAIIGRVQYRERARRCQFIVSGETNTPEIARENKGAQCKDTSATTSGTKSVQSSGEGLQLHTLPSFDRYWVLMSILPLPFFAQRNIVFNRHVCLQLSAPMQSLCA